MGFATDQLAGDQLAGDLLTRAAAAYRDVVADPGRFTAEAARLVSEARAAGHPEALVLALRAEAWAERTRLDDSLAKRLLDEAAALARRHGLHARLGEVLTSRGAVNLELGRVPAARRDLERATRLVAGRAPAELLLQQAALFHNMGRLAAAARLYRQALADRTAPPEVRAKVANNLALIDVVHGRVEAAFGCLDEASAAAARSGPALVAIVAQSRGWVTVQAGRVAESLRQFDRASVLYERAGLPLGEHYLEYVDALADLRLLPEATAISRRAVRDFEAHGVPLMAAEAQCRLARLLLLSGDLPEAAVAARAATSTFRAQRRRAWTARAELIRLEAAARAGAATPADVTALRRAARSLSSCGITSSAVEGHLAAGRAALGLGRLDTALQDLDLARALSRRTPVLPRLNGRVAAALAARARGQHAVVLRHCRAGLDDLARHRAALPSMQLRALASGHGAELGRVGLEVVLGTASPRRVFDWMERTRAAATYPVEPASADVSEPEPGELRAARPGTTPADSLRVALGDRVLVAYGELHGELFATVLTSARTQLIRLGGLEVVEHERDALLFALRRLAAATSTGRASLARRAADVGLRRLCELLVEPLRLDPGQELVVVPIGVLQRVPWMALHAAPVSVAPSAALWSRTRQAEALPDNRVVLVCGPGLDGAAEEIAALTRLYDGATVLCPPESSVAAVAASLVGADLVHLACHGLLRSDNPAFSALQLSDGPLTVHEIDLRGIAPRRVVLAACDSAADVPYEGNEMLGFVSALFARGTTALVASVVSIPDAHTVALMAALHEGLRGGLRVAPALHAARETLDRDDPQAFANWCAFSAFGAG